MIVDEEVYLEHYGVPGMKWGVRSAKTVGRGSKRTIKAVGRSAKKTAKFTKEHPNIVVGAAFAATLLAAKSGTTRQSAKALKINSPDMKRVAQTGIAWKVQNGPWEYTVPLTPGPYSLKWK